MQLIVVKAIFYVIVSFFAISLIIKSVFLMPLLLKKKIDEVMQKSQELQNTDLYPLYGHFWYLPIWSVIIFFQFIISIFFITLFPLFYLQMYKTLNLSIINSWFRYCVVTCLVKSNTLTDIDCANLPFRWLKNICSQNLIEIQYNNNCIWNCVWKFSHMFQTPMY